MHARARIVSDRIHHRRAGGSATFRSGHRRTAVVAPEVLERGRPHRREDARAARRQRAIKSGKINAGEGEC